MTGGEMESGMEEWKRKIDILASQGDTAGVEKEVNEIVNDFGKVLRVEGQWEGKKKVSDWILSLAIRFFPKPKMTARGMVETLDSLNLPEEVKERARQALENMRRKT